MIFHLLGNDAAKTKALMEQLVSEGEYTLPDVDQSILDLFEAGYATESLKRLLKSNVSMKHLITLRTHIQQLRQLFIKNTQSAQVIKHQP